MNRKAQQEMVGFVLIVVLVIIGMMVFLIISLRDSGEVTDSLEVDNMIGAVMRHTTECAIVFEPQYDTFEDLFKSCYDNDKCDNLGVDACDYLNESLRDVVGLSAIRHAGFGKNYGVQILDGPLGGMFSPAVIVTDENNTVVHREHLEDITMEPDYEAAFRALGIEINT